MKKRTSVTFMLMPLLLAAVVVSACSGETTRHPPGSASGNIFPLPQGADGVVVAQTELNGLVDGITATMDRPDCYGAGMGVTVSSTTGDHRIMFDKDGQPCDSANILFDGKAAKNKRAGDPSVNIKFIERFGARVQTQSAVGDGGLPIVAAGMTTPAGNTVEGLAGIAAQPPAYGESADVMPSDIAAAAAEAEGANFVNTIGQWKDAENRAALMREAERLMADARNASRIANLEQLRDQQDRITRLTAHLRAAEREAQAEQQRHESMSTNLAASRQMLDAERVQQDRTQQGLREQVERLSAQINDFERYGQTLRRQHDSQKEAYERKIAELSAELKTSRAEAESARHAAVLQAAQQIAEAERLALAAQVSQRQAMEREAARLMREADVLSGKARSLPAEAKMTQENNLLDRSYADLVSGRLEGGQVDKIARVITRATTDVATLEAAQLTLHERDRPLKDIIGAILTDLEPQVGQWQLQWELDDENLRIPDERWTVAAESTFNEFLRYVVEKVYDLHGVKLSFKVFDRTRLIVVTDNPADAS